MRNSELELLAAGRHQAVADNMGAEVTALLPAGYRGCDGGERAA